MEQQLLEKFESQLISRAIDQLGETELSLMHNLAVNRVPIYRNYYSKTAHIFPDSKKTRVSLIERFLLEANSRSDVMHPLAREITVTRLRESTHKWKKAHDAAAEYQIELFKNTSSNSEKARVASYVELRHHLFESDRSSELSIYSSRMRAFVLSRIPKPAQSHIPQSTESLENHIILISSLPEQQRTKGLLYHLALCLRERNSVGDYDKALLHARKAVGKGVYYAVWLLLADLEFSLNGPDALKRVVTCALDDLGTSSNASAIYLHCANLLDKAGNSDEAVEFIQEAIKKPKLECKASLLVLCLRILEREGKLQRANELLASEVSGPEQKEAGKIFTHWASMLIRQNQFLDAIELLNQGISQKRMTKLHSLYYLKSQALVALGETAKAKTTLWKGINDNRIIDTVKLFQELAKLLTIEGELDRAVTLLQKAADTRSVRDPVPLFLSIASIFEEKGDYNLGAQLLEQALKNSKLKHEHSIHLACSKLHFRAKNLPEATNVLRRALTAPRLRERNQLVISLADYTHRQGSTKKAIELLEDAFQNGKDPRQLGKVYQSCARLQEGQGDYTSAERTLRHGLTAPAISDKGVLAQSLAKNLAKQGRHSDGVQTLREAVKWPGVSGLVGLYHTGATILIQAKSINDALDLLDEGLEKRSMGNRGSLYKLRAEILDSIGKRSEAIEFLKIGESEYPKDQSIKLLLAKLKEE